MNIGAGAGPRTETRSEARSAPPQFGRRLFRQRLIFAGNDQRRQSAEPAAVRAFAGSVFPTQENDRGHCRPAPAAPRFRDTASGSRLRRSFRRGRHARPPAKAADRSVRPPAGRCPSARRSASTMPTNVSSGKWCPLARIWVPIKISSSPLSIFPKISETSARLEVVSLESTAVRAAGKRLATSSAIRSIPRPQEVSPSSDPQSGQRTGRTMV